MSEQKPTGIGWTPAAVVAVYLIFGFLWILLSDRIVNTFVGDIETRHLLQTYKGWFYVFVTGLFLFGLIRASVRRTERIDAARISTLERYDKLVENANDAIFTLDVDGNFTAANRAVSSITGYSADELLQMKFEEILAPEDRDYLSHLLDPQATQNPSSIREVKIKCKDGHFGFLEISSRPLSLQDNRASIENIARDVTLRHRMQAELEDAKRRYQRLIETANEGIWTTDANLVVTLVNRTLNAVTGFEAESLLGRGLSDLFGSQLAQYCTGDALEKLTAKPHSFDLEFTRPDGQKIWLLITSSPLSEADEFSGLLFMATDITERKNAETMLRESEERFRVLFERSAMGGVILSEDQRVVDCNRKACEMLGYTRDELIKLTVFDFDVGLSKDEILDLREVRIATKRQVEFETVHRTKSGENRNVFVAGTSILLRGKDYTVASFFDITERERAVEALRKSEDRLRGLYRIISDSTAGTQGRVARLLEFGTREFQVETGLLLEKVDDSYAVLNAFSPEHRIAPGAKIDLSLTLYDAARDDDEPLAIEHIGESGYRNHPGYANFGVEVYLGIPIQLSNGKRCALCFTSRVPRKIPFTSGDLEFLKLMAQWTGSELTRESAEQALRASEEQLLQSQKLESVGRLAGGIAHDFNNMLTAINGYSDLILSKMKPEDSLRHNISEIKRAGERSAALTQQLLAFSRKQILNPETLNINRAISDISSLLERLIGEDIRLVVSLAPDAGTVEVDPGQLSQVIVNLAVNARDAMPNGGTLTISTANASGESFLSDNLSGTKAVSSYVRISVADTGIGMDEEVRRKLFEPFFTTKDVGKGTGLGLATVYGFIKQSDGHIEVESSPGAGSTFDIYLPCVAPLAESAIHTTDGQRSRSGAETILLVEDEEIVRRLGCDVLTSCGYTVIEATDGDDAIKICKETETPIDLLLTDVVMPRMNGRELWEKLSAVRPEMRVLFTSGYTDDMVVRSGIRNEETNFLQKPFAVDDLIKKVREILDEE